MQNTVKHDSQVLTMLTTEDSTAATTALLEFTPARARPQTSNAAAPFPTGILTGFRKTGAGNNAVQILFLIPILISQGCKLK